VLQSEAFPKLKVDSGVSAILEEKGLEKTLLKLCDRLADALGLGSGGLGGEEEESSFDFALTEGLKPRNDIVSFTKAYKYGTFETKLKMEYSSAREVKAALSTGAITKSLLSVSKRGKVALGEGDKVTVFEAAVLTAAAAEKGAPKPLSKNAVRFQVLNLEFNPANDAHLVVSGYEDCHVFILNARGEVMDRLALELALEPETFLVQATWVPGSQVELLVVSNRSVKIYDLSKDKISPVYFVTVPQESIKQAVLARDAEGVLCIFVLTQQGVLFSGKLRPQEGSEGAITLTERLQLPSDRQWPGSRGCSLSYFPEHRTLVSSYEDGQVVIGRLAGSFAGFEKLCFLSENERSGNLHLWRAVNESSGVYVAANSTRQGAAVAVQLAKGTVGTQPLRQVGESAALRMEGVATYVPPGAGEKCTLLVLNDDGSLQVFSYAPAEKRVPLGAARSVSKADGLDRTAVQAAATAPSFPLTFFESTTCITQSVTWGGDLGDTDAIKLSLAAEESFLEGPSARPFKIVVNNPGAENVMVGCRIHVGATGRTNLPSRVRVFERSIPLEEGRLTFLGLLQLEILLPFIYLVCSALSSCVLTPFFFFFPNSLEVACNLVESSTQSYSEEA
jgi:E3 ubiquitin-protein ligase UBR4